MSERVEFTPAGLFYYRWSDKKEAWFRRCPHRSSILTHLRKPCDIVEGTTLRHIFDAVDRYPLLKGVISQYSWCPQIDAFHAQAREPQRPDPDEDDPLDYLEICHCPGAHRFEGVIYFGTSTGFHGLGPLRKDKENDPIHRGLRNDDGRIAYSVSCTPMWALADLPVRLNKEFTIYAPHVAGKTPRELLTATCEFSLLEVLDAIYDDISFHGGPAENREFLEEMRETVEKIKRGELTGTPLEDSPDEPGRDVE